MEVCLWVTMENVFIKCSKHLRNTALLLPVATKIFLSHDSPLLPPLTIASLHPLMELPIQTHMFPAGAQHKAQQ